MAVFLESLHDRSDKSIPASRVVPDLQAQLPGLFGSDAPVNSVRATLFTTKEVAYFPRRTMYPLDYIGVHAVTGADMDKIDISAHQSLHGGGWQTEVQASLHNEPGFEAWWEGDSMDPNSRRLTFMWADNLPGISIHSRNGFVLPDHTVHHAPIGLVEFMKRRGKGNRWLKEVCADFPVEITAFDVNPGLNFLAATFTPRDSNRKPFYLRLPLVLETQLRNGVPGRMAVKSFPTAE
ncbi:hypothetical protein HZB58_02250 [Candidatus Gottesmanbacteria bacterium]|nr:hypothetical protein [Candidatus Gottesmanbacteria bacterium]